MSYAVGTRGVGDDCAPSLTQGADYEETFISALLAKGWAVAVSDYQGLGTPGLHTYMVGPARGHAALEMARAAERLPGTGLSATSPVGLMGYSQGESGAGWAAQLAGSYARPEGEGFGDRRRSRRSRRYRRVPRRAPFVALALMALAWLEARFVGLPTWGNCFLP